jgi:ABC-2 type transport system permease protein
MRNMLLIAKREYLEQVRGRAFRVTTVGLPAVFALIVGVGYLSSLGLGSNKHMAIAASDKALADDLRGRLQGDKDAKATVDVVAPATQADRAALLGEVQSKTIDGLLWIDSPAGAVPEATYYSQSSGDFITTARLKDALNDSVVDVHLTGGGMKPADADAVLKGVTLSTFQVKKNGSVVKSNAQSSFWKGYVMAILLSMTTMIYGMNVARSIIQEKTSRIFEVMLATAKPSDLLAGKLIGVGAVGLTQIVIWLVAGAAILVSPFTAALLSGEWAVHFSWVEAVLFPVYFLLGYLLYSSLFAGLAATCETEQELQMYMPLAAAPTWLSFALILLVINDSNSAWSIAASLFPPCAPIIMFLRMASQIPPWWQFAASIGLMILSIWGVLWMSSRLYRVGILMYGKRATLPELLRWLRYS